MNTADVSEKCGYCGSTIRHPGVCPSVRAFEYHENGTIKRVEFHPPQPMPYYYPPQPSYPMWPQYPVSTTWGTTGGSDAQMVNLGWYSAFP